MRDRIIAHGVVLALIFCLTARPVLNAADADAGRAGNARSLSEELFRYASDLGRSLHDRSSEDRNNSDYRRALDAYGQVIRLNSDNFYTAEALSRQAELLREMADDSNDSAVYQQAIEAYRELVSNHPRSAFVGAALVGIAQIYEENLQDLEGAAAAYRELAAYFPNSVMSREARAVLSRFEAQLGNRPVDVMIPPTSASPTGPRLHEGGPELTNVRNFGGADYARVVLDLSENATYTQHREGNHLSLQLDKATVARSLYGRRFIVGENNLLKRITVVQTEGATPKIDMQVASLGEYSVIRLSEPERIIIDMHSFDPRRPVVRNFVPTPEPESAVARNSETPTGVTARPEAPRSSRNQNPMYSLPELTEPIVAEGLDEAKKAISAPATLSAKEPGPKSESKVVESPVKRIVIDPGHGGHDTGTISPGGMREKDLVLDVGRRLRAYVKKSYPDVEVILTRDSDKFVALEERTAIANSRHADLFISIHANASPSRAASGVETYFVSPDRAKPDSPQPAPATQSSATEKSAVEPEKAAAKAAEEKPQPVYASVTVANRVGESRELARYIQSGLVRGIGAASPRTGTNRGVKHAAFVVLLGASMPSVLAEVSFLSNARDEALLQKTEFRDRIAASLFAGLNSYLKRARG
ncbi:MAG TPA: N-acetylmuramoyl-L-alanine amidase [Blastocatellia bacterium]|nr:N-acetylmuramoyl-L-alanine amidase [Blastocatellia bacterium]